MRQSPHAGWRAGGSILRYATLAGLGGLLASSLVAGLVGDRATVLSALAGALVVLLVVDIGLLAISAVVASEVSLSMAGAAVVYIGQIVLIVTALLVIRDRDWLDGRAFAFAAIGQVLLMQVAQVIGYSRGRQLLDSPPTVAERDDRAQGGHQ
ncbi:MAG: hypothetical protein WCA30_17350 [Dermatophilaceae bacterium]